MPRRSLARFLRAARVAEDASPGARLELITPTMGSTTTLRNGVASSSSRPWTTTTTTTTASTETPRRPGYSQKSKRKPLKTPAVSPASWKDSLKQACLERARRKRQEVIWRHRQSTTDNMEINTARLLVQDELRTSGVAIIQQQQQQQQPDVEMSLEGEENNAISEAELYELMQEVEEELQRDADQRLHEEMEEVELCEQLSKQHLETQIQEFQDWEEEKGNEDDVVLCPICKESNLVQEQNGVVACLGNHNGTCPLRLQQAPVQEMNLIPMIRGRLGTAYEMHACTCSSPLEFQLQATHADNDTLSLVATCDTCHSNVIIL